MGGQRLLGLPQRAVHALQHRPRFLTTPIGAGDPRHLKCVGVDLARPTDVRAAAQVFESTVPVGREHDVAVVGLVTVGIERATEDRLNDLELVRLIREEPPRFVRLEPPVDERHVFADDLPHALLDAGQIFVSERPRQLEIVVEPILCRGSRPQLGARE